MENRKINFLLLIITFLTVGCGSKNLQRKQKVADQSYSKQAPSEYLQSLNSSQRELYELLVSSEDIYNQEIKKSIRSVDTDRLMSEVVGRLKSKVLSQNFILDPEISKIKTPEQGSLVGRLVLVFNQSINVILRVRPEQIHESDILKKYKQLVLWNCFGEEKSRGCHLVKFFKYVDAANTVRILQTIFTTETNEAEKDKIVKAAYEINNNSLNNEIRQMLFEKLAYHFTLVQQHKENNAGARIDRNQLRNNAYLFADTLGMTVSEVTKKEDFVKLLKIINPFNLSRKSGSAFDPGISSLHELAARHLMYTNGKDLSPEMKAAINSKKYVVGSHSERGALFHLDNLRGLWKEKFHSTGARDSFSHLSASEQMVKSSVDSSFDKIIFFDKKSSQVIENFLEKEKQVTAANDKSQKVTIDKVSFEWDEYDFIAHQFYHGVFNANDTFNYWNNSSKNQLRMTYALLNIIKLKIVNNIVYTNNVMRDILETHKELPLMGLMTESAGEAQQIKSRWTRIKDRSLRLQTFVGKISTSDDQKLQAAVSEIFDVRKYLADNIKYLVTYPNMFTLMKFIAVNRKTDTIMGFFTRQLIPVLWQTVISRFFVGSFEPLYDFGNDGEVLDSTQIIYSLYYSFLSGIFDTFSVGEDPVVNENDEVVSPAQDFVNVVIEKIVSETREQLNSETNRITTVIDRMNSTDMEHLLSVCREERSLQAEEELRIQQLVESSAGDPTKIINGFRDTLSPRKSSFSEVAFNAIHSSVYNYTRQEKGKYGAYFKDLYSLDNLDFLIKIQTEIEKKMTSARLALDMFSIYSKTDRNKLESAYAIQFKEINELKSSYISKLLEANQTINQCDWLLARRDKIIRHALVFEEIKFLGTLFDEMFALSKKVGLEQMENPSESTLDELWQLRAKLFSFANEGSLFSDEFQQSALYKKNLGKSKLDFKTLTTFRIDIFARVAYNLTQLFPRQYGITPPGPRDSIFDNTENSSSDFNLRKITELDLAETDPQVQRARQNFIQSGMSSFAEIFGSENWATRGYNVKSLSTKGDILVKLYKLGNTPSDRNESDDCASSELDQLPKPKKCLKVEVGDLLDHYRQMIDFINISPTEEIILDHFAAQEKYIGQNSTDYEDYIKYLRRSELLSVYDMVFKRVISDFKDAKVSPYMWFVADLVSYNSSIENQSRSSFIFDYQDEINPVFEEKYGAWVENYLQSCKKFVSEIAKLRLEPTEAKNSLQATRFSYEKRRYHKLGEWKFTGLEPFVSDYMLNQFYSTITKLNNETSQHFKPIIDKYRTEIKSIVKESNQQLKLQVPDLESRNAL